MNRREFNSLLGGTAVAWPLAAHAQQRTIPMIGFLTASKPDWPSVAAFWRGLKELGYVEGDNVAIEYRGADGQYDRLPALAADLVRRQAAVIIAIGGAISALAARAASPTIPIVSLMASDPVKLGLATSLNRPGGNVTGVSVLVSTLTAKRLELLSELVPNASSFAALVNPTNVNADSDVKEAHAAGRMLGKKIHVLNARSDSELDAAFASCVEQGAGGMVVLTDLFFTNRRNKIAGLAIKHKAPGIYYWREFAEAGGLISYGANLHSLFHGLGIYAGRILKGAKAAELPIQQPTTFELVINLKTAKTLGLAVPPALMAIADEVIE